MGHNIIPECLWNVRLCINFYTLSSELLLFLFAHLSPYRSAAAILSSHVIIAPLEPKKKVDKRLHMRPLILTGLMCGSGRRGSAEFFVIRPPPKWLTTLKSIDLRSTKYNVISLGGSPWLQRFP